MLAAREMRHGILNCGLMAKPWSLGCARDELHAAGQGQGQGCPRGAGLERGTGQGRGVGPLWRGGLRGAGLRAVAVSCG